MCNYMRTFNLIFARTVERGIGHKNKIPWHDPCDLKNFKNITEDNIVIMGKNTFDSIGKELPNRINIIITRYYTFEFALRSLCNEEFKNKSIFVIGGSVLYNYCIRMYSHLITKIYITIITDEHYECDTFIDYLNEEEKYNVIKEFYTKKKNRITEATRHNEDECRYLELLEEIYEKGNGKKDRTGVGTLSLFSKTLSFNLKDGLLPLFTTKLVSL